MYVINIINATDHFEGYFKWSIILDILRIAEKLTSEKLDVPEVTQSQEGQKQKLRIVLSTVNRVKRTSLYLTAEF